MCLDVPIQLGELCGWQGEVCQKETRDLRTVGQPIVSGPCRHFADLSTLQSEAGNLVGFGQRSDISQDYRT